MAMMSTDEAVAHMRVLMQRREYERISPIAVDFNDLKDALIITAQDTDTEIVACIVPDRGRKRCGKSEACKAFDALCKENRHVILVVPVTTSHIDNEAKRRGNLGTRAEVLDHDDIFCDKPNVIYVPHMRKLSRVEGETLCKKYMITPEKLPKMLPNDPMCRYLDYKPGDIIECMSKANPNDINYRYVCV